MDMCRSTEEAALSPPPPLYLILGPNAIGQSLYTPVPLRCPPNDSLEVVWTLVHLVPAGVTPYTWEQSPVV